MITLTKEQRARWAKANNECTPKSRSRSEVKHTNSRGRYLEKRESSKHIGSILSVG